MSNSNNQDDFAVFNSNEKPLDLPTGDIDLEVSNDGEDVSGKPKPQEDQHIDMESANKPEADHDVELETESSLEEQYREQVQDVEEEEYEDEDEKPRQSHSGKGNVLLWCLTGISLLFAAGGVFTGLTAQSKANSYANDLALMQEQIDGVKSRAVNEAQAVTDNKAAIEKLQHDQLTMFQMSEKTNGNVTTLSEKIDVLDKTVNEKSLATDSALIRLNNKVDAIEQAAAESAKKLAAAKKQQVKKASSHKQKPVVRKYKKITGKPKAKPVQSVYRVNGITLASIDMWNHKFSATLMSKDGFRVIYPGYNVDGFIVKSIDAHSVTFIAPNNRLVKLRN
ncbi:hypothetical protein [Photobacterium leiognathi]|uniref:hypothetical protein n=1 Tax=Photobacterium leiognathi TaxID=553611 RepID=UPI0029823EF9|nr:hypothetical protein [Photobacterium leiognathi]